MTSTIVLGNTPFQWRNHEKLALATAVAALSVSAAQATPTVYGKAFLTIDANNTDTTYNSGLVQLSEDTNESGLNLKYLTHWF